MRLSLLLTLQVGIHVRSSLATYQLTQDYSGDNFFSGWDFYSGQDYTHGFVEYQSQQDATAQGLVSIQSDQDTQKQAYIGVDFTHVTPNGRPSVRLESKASLGPGLVIADFAHAPGGICGTWPAFWLVGPDWPNGGEIDIIEGVHEQSQNAMTLHTRAGISLDTATSDISTLFTGKMTTSNCDVNAPNQPLNSGCSIQDPRPASYGTGFNAIGGGVYATQWTSGAIKIWFFPRSNIPENIQAGSPNPDDSWGEPAAAFLGNMDTYFKDQKIILDTTFCGDWAGAVWQYSSCSTRAPTCDAYVRNNPGDFEDAYWLVNYIKVYQDEAENNEPYTSSASTSVSASTTANEGTSTTLQPTVTSASTNRPGRTRTRTETVVVTPLRPTTTLVSPTRSGSVPSLNPNGQPSSHRTRTRTRTVTVTPTPLRATHAARARATALTPSNIQGRRSTSHFRTMRKSRIKP